jgi:diaminopimelate decarboxylase
MPVWRQLFRGRPILYGSHHDICFLSPTGSPVSGPVCSIAVAGPLCEAGDVFTPHDGGFVAFRELLLPQVGDLAIVRDVGAYGATMSSNYNSRPSYLRSCWTTEGLPSSASVSLSSTS